MSSGKSLSLLQVAHNYDELGQKALLYTSALDNRYGVGKITTRLGQISRDAKIFDKDTDFLSELDGNTAKYACILLDEAQFLTKAQVQQLHYLAQCRDIPVIAYGLRSDSRGEPFEGAAYLLALAETIEELKTACQCGRKATMNMRVDSEGNMVVGGEQVVIGGNDCYKAVCGRCFYETREKRQKQLSASR
jgi:thymidine kinase